MKLQVYNSDNLGAIASVLCMIHCAVTPFLFVVQTCSVTCCESSPTWWKWIDYMFLTISFFAIYHSVETTSKKWVKLALWFSWVALCLVIINERIEFIQLPKYATYIVASVLVILHLYNSKFCKCKQACCSI